MSQSWLGCLVSIDCGEVLGTYQGCVSVVNSEQQTISITQTFRNGIPSQVPQITLNASDIKDLRILKSPTEAKGMPCLQRLLISNADSSSQNNNEGTAASVRQSIAKEDLDNRLLLVNADHHRGSRSLSPKRRHSASPTKPMRNGSAKGSRQQNEFFNSKISRTGSPNYTSPHGDIGNRRRNNSVSEERLTRKSTTPRKIDFQRRTPREDCFSAPIDSFQQEFDFEKNLALFDKQAVFEEIENSGSNQNIPRQCDRKNPAKFKHDENVLKSGPVRYSQIKVPTPTGTEFVTDQGLVIPAISYDIRCNLFHAAESHGFSPERLLEMAGRSAAEMVLQLLGGSHRLNPQNTHQRPTVAVLCGPHIAGAQAVNCARHLAVRGVKVKLFAQSFVKMLPELEQELKLYQLTEGERISSVKDLPSKPVDIIISALDSHQSKVLEHQSWFTEVISWANQNKAPVLAVDPPAEGAAINTKWCLCFCLPLNLGPSCGQVYLADLGFPTKVFSEAGITYRNPFGHKFVIPLHAKT